MATQNLNIQVSAAPGSDEAVKAQHGIRVARGNTAYTNINPTATIDLSKWLNEGYCQPSDADIERATSGIVRLMEDKKIPIIVPMREPDPEPAAEANLAYLTRFVPAEQITVVWDDSSAEALESVRAFPGVRLIETAEILRSLDWGRLSPILGVPEIPKGKGTAILASLLLTYQQSGQTGLPPWVFFNDSEISNPYEYEGFRCLALGALQNPTAQYGKIARGGRNNETPMAARVMQQILAGQWPGVSKRIQRRAQQIFGLCRDKWMLTGEFCLSTKWAFRTPILSGYLVETNLSIAAQDFTANGHLPVFKVEGLGPRCDGSNPHWKEDIMMTSISNFLQALSLCARPLTNWDVDFIRWMNNDSPFAKEQPMVIIPKGTGPLESRVMRPEKIWPSVKQLVEGGFVNMEELRRIV